MSIKAIELAFACYAVNDLKRAREFYEGKLGLKATSAVEGPGFGFVEYDIGAGTLAIGFGAPNFKPGVGGATVALEVEDFPAALQHLRSTGVPFFMEQVETRVCFMAAISDPDGNVLMVHKRKPGHG